MSAQRALALIGLGWLALVLLTVVQALCPWHLPVPQLMLLIVLYVALSRPASAAGEVGMALVLGYLADLFGGSPRGLNALSLALIVLVARNASSRLMVTTVWQTVTIAFSAAVLNTVLLIAFSSSMYPGTALAALRAAPSSALLTAALAPFTFAALHHMDRRLEPDPRALRMT